MDLENIDYELIVFILKKCKDILIDKLNYY